MTDPTHAAEAATRALSSASSSATPSASSASETSPSMSRPSASLLGKFWERMAAMFGHTWVSQYGDDAGDLAGDTWAACLEGLTGSQIAVGFRALRDSGREWPPSAPAFRAMCFGIPSLAMVKLDIQQETRDRQPFTRLVWELLDRFGFTRAEQDRAERMLLDAYELAQAHVLAGGPLPDAVPLFVEHQPEPAKPASSEVARKALDEIGDILGVVEGETEALARESAQCDEG